MWDKDLMDRAGHLVWILHILALLQPFLNWLHVSFKMAMFSPVINHRFSYNFLFFCQFSPLEIPIFLLCGGVKSDILPLNMHLCSIFDSCQLVAHGVLTATQELPDHPSLWTGREHRLDRGAVRMCGSGTPIKGPKPEAEVQSAQSSISALNS